MLHFRRFSVLRTCSSVGVILIVLLCAACDSKASPSATPIPLTVDVAELVNTLTALPMTPTPTVPIVCAPATPATIAVSPLTSPTDQTSEEIKLTSGPIHDVKITSQAGTFDFLKPPYRIPLLPNTENDLVITVVIDSVTRQGICVYGGYILNTTHDVNGAPLKIVQQLVLPTPKPAAF